MSEVKTPRPTGRSARRERYAPAGGFPRIGDLAFLSNRRTVVVLARDGRICWLCVPCMGDASIFTSLLGGTGHFDLRPNDAIAPDARRYYPGTLVLESTWRTSTGYIEVRDFLVWSNEEEPDDMLVRMVTCTKGVVTVSMNCTPFFNYDQISAIWQEIEATGCRRAAAEHKGLELQISSDMDVRFDGPACISNHTLQENETVFVALGWGEKVLPSTAKEAEELLHRTIRCSRDWLADGEIPDHPFGPAIAHSAMVLGGLCHPTTGAIAAAGTTSLPERPKGTGEGRTWDYRYVWVRDGVMTAMVLYLVGFRQEAEDFIDFILDRPDLWNKLQIMYGLGGQVYLKERILNHLEGYKGFGPVRVGNGAYLQNQFDLWGQILHLIYLVRGDRVLGRTTWRAVIHLVDSALRVWRNPDRGIWEVRGAPKRFTSSALYLWLAVDCGAKLAARQPGMGNSKRASGWAKKAKEIRAWILQNTVDEERGVFTIAPGESKLDASCLLIPLLGFLPPDDERVRRTVEAIGMDLSTERGLVWRYQTAEVDDGLGGTEEGTFFICSFWMVAALALIGEKERAENLFSELLSHANEVGLYAEQVMPDTREHLGNFPQALSHLGLILAALTLIRGEAILAVGDPKEAAGTGDS